MWLPDEPFLVPWDKHICLDKNALFFTNTILDGKLHYTNPRPNTNILMHPGQKIYIIHTGR